MKSYGPFIASLFSEFKARHRDELIQRFQKTRQPLHEWTDFCEHEFERFCSSSTNKPMRNQK